MLSSSIKAQAKKAEYKILDDGTCFGEISGLKGIWSNADNLKDCRKQLREVLEDYHNLS